MENESIYYCAQDPSFFIDQCCRIESVSQRGWVPFKLWDKQRGALEHIHTHPQVVVLKARQLGLTWLSVCYALWMMLFDHGAGVLFFSRRENEAQELLERLRGVHTRLPKEIRARITRGSAHSLEMGDIGSWARCFSTSRHSGRSYAAAMAIVDEADFIPDLNLLLNAIKPTIDQGGKLVLISTADKANQASAFKRIWHAAVNRTNTYKPIFLPWGAHPDRDRAWYRRQKADYHQDDLYQEYPATPEQALAARASSKRFPLEWIENCRGGKRPQKDTLGVPGFTPYVNPVKKHIYLVSADPAEGNPGSDPSAAVVLDAESGEEVAVIYGTFEPDIFASYLKQVATHYNHAVVLVERNNHGHAVLLALEYTGYPDVYESPLDNKPGWLSNRRDKVLAVDNCARVLREKCCLINHSGTLQELVMLEAATLRAPQGEHDDLAIAFINALAGLKWTTSHKERGVGESMVITYPDILDGMGEVF